MIQMTTYSGGRKKRRGEREWLVPMQRQREPRENSDFLRVIVLEMNMRRKGKLDAKSLGRARVWLPPRKGGDKVEELSTGKDVPKRWVGISAPD